MTPLATIPFIALMAFAVVAYGRWLDSRKKQLPTAEYRSNSSPANSASSLRGWAFSRSPRCADTCRVFPQMQSAAGRLGKGEG